MQTNKAENAYILYGTKIIHFRIHRKLVNKQKLVTVTTIQTA